MFGKFTEEYSQDQHGEGVGNRSKKRSLPVSKFFLLELMRLSESCKIGDCDFGPTHSLVYTTNIY